MNSNTTPFQYIMFGDSITEYGNWNQLLNHLMLLNKGISGNTSRDLLIRFDKAIDKSADVVLIMIGINDLIQKRKPDKVFGNYIKILEKLQSLNIKPIVQSTLFVGKDFHKLDPNINYNVAQLNTKLLEYCKEKNIIYLDINKILAPHNILEDQYTHDSVHINEKAYIKWSEYLKSEILF